MRPKTVGEVGELRLISEYVKPRFPAPPGAVGIGDDAAMVPVEDGRLLVASTDRVPADFLAFKLGAIGYRQLGRYLVALNVSDIAASGAEPLGMLLSLSLPNDFPLEQLEELLDGVAMGAEQCRCPLLGGDTSDGFEIGLVAAALGHVERGSELRRNGAKPGDRVVVSKLPGSGAAILSLLLDEELRERHRDWRERVAEHIDSLKPELSLSRKLAEERSATSCIDNTDGLAVSLDHLATASGVGIELDREAALHPIAKRIFMDEPDPWLRALGPGVDLGLVATIESGAGGVSEDVHTIGVVTNGKGVSYVASDGSRVAVDPHGWEYFHS